MPTINKPSKVQEFSVREFFARFHSDDVCLEHIMEVRHGLRHTCGKCGVVDASFHKLASRPAYSCASCGAHVYPCAGTIFQDTRTPLQVWFYAIYLFTTTRHGVSGKELQRTLGVTYKTAWRIGQQIRILMGNADGFEILQGHVELDEAYVGGKRPGKRGRGAAGKTIVMGLAERGGRIATEVIPNVSMATLHDVVTRNVEKGSTVSTDELVSYGLLSGDGFKHGQVKHGEKDYAHYDYRTAAVMHVNTVESFWKMFRVFGRCLRSRFVQPTSTSRQNIWRGISTSLLPGEPSRDEERDVRSANRAGLTAVSINRPKTSGSPACPAASS